MTIKQTVLKFAYLIEQLKNNKVFLNRLTFQRHKFISDCFFCFEYVNQVGYIYTTKNSDQLLQCIRSMIIFVCLLFAGSNNTMDWDGKLFPLNELKNYNLIENRIKWG